MICIYLTVVLITHTQVDYENDMQWQLWCLNAKRALLGVVTPPLPQEVGRNTPLTTSTLVSFESVQRLMQVEPILKNTQITQPTFANEDIVQDYNIQGDPQDVYNSDELLKAVVESPEGSDVEYAMQDIDTEFTEETGMVNRFDNQVGHHKRDILTQLVMIVLLTF